MFKNCPTWVGKRIKNIKGIMNGAEYFFFAKFD